MSFFQSWSSQWSRGETGFMFRSLGIGPLNCINMQHEHTQARYSWTVSRNSVIPLRKNSPGETCSGRCGDYMGSRWWKQDICCTYSKLHYYYMCQAQLEQECGGSVITVYDRWQANTETRWGLHCPHMNTQLHSFTITHARTYSNAMWRIPCVSILMVSIISW